MSVESLRYHARRADDLDRYGLPLRESGVGVLRKLPLSKSAHGPAKSWRTRSNRSRSSLSRIASNCSRSPILGCRVPGVKLQGKVGYFGLAWADAA